MNVEMTTTFVLLFLEVQKGLKWFGRNCVMYWLTRLCCKNVQ